MKFLMKSALDGISPPRISPRFLSSGSPPADTFLSNFLYGVKDFRNHLHSYYISKFLKNRLDKLWKETFDAHRASKVKTPDIDLMPLIKATTYIEKCNANQDLTGRSILCVGGRAKLYPIYRHLVEASGGRLMTFYGDSHDPIDQLHELLTFADMVICPVDCVNHEAYFMVKSYCKCANKLCVLLDRSQIAVFQKGIETLTTLAAKQTQLSRGKPLNN